MTLRARRWCAGRSAVLQLPDPLPPAVWQKPGATASCPCPHAHCIFFYHHRQNPRLTSSRETWMSTQMTHLIPCPHISLTFSSPLTFSCKLPFSPTPSVPSWTYPQQKWFGPWNQASFVHRGLTLPPQVHVLHCSVAIHLKTPLSHPILNSLRWRLSVLSMQTGSCAAAHPVLCEVAPPIPPWNHTPPVSLISSNSTQYIFFENF